MRLIFSKGIAAVAKPRCGSTSIRRMLNRLMAEGDIGCDTAKPGSPLHPHITAPALRKLVAGMGRDPAALTFVMTVRNPQALLWSCYNFFKPDSASRYSFEPGWTDTRMPYDQWIMTGRAPANADWLALGPRGISTRDLTPLSYEFRALNSDGSSAVDRIFKLEEMGLMADWLEEKTGVALNRMHVNASGGGTAPDLEPALQERVKRLFPYESRLYGL